MTIKMIADKRVARRPNNTREKWLGDITALGLKFRNWDLDDTVNYNNPF